MNSEELLKMTETLFRKHLFDVDSDKLKLTLDSEFLLWLMTSTAASFGFTFWELSCRPSFLMSMTDTNRVSCGQNSDGVLNQVNKLPWQRFDSLLK